MDPTASPLAVTAHDTAAQKAGRMPVALDFASLPVVGRSTARQQRLVVDERFGAVLTHALGVTGWNAGTRNPLDAARTARLSLRWGVQNASVLLDVAQLPGLDSVVQINASNTPDESNPQLDAELRASVSALLLAPLLDALAQLGMDGVEVVTVERVGALNEASTECCAVSFVANDTRYDAVIEQIDDGWLEAFETLVAQHRMPFATHVSEIEVRGRILLGEKSISLTALDSLRPGDVILRALPEGLRAFFQNEAASVKLPIVWGHHGTRQLHAMADVTHDQLTLTGNPTMSHDTSFNTPLADSRDALVEIDHLDLPLKLEIDTVSLPVAQLSALRAGYVLELPTALPDARIRLVTYGQTIGFGELVSVGDHLGVRLVQLSQSHGSV
ncbi:type III secretion system cytoplasmic ring protein SctQ [Paraburkholderia flava]|uniref:type III secretion system cytoplasmic ring protein SctQ n=1 Tax=Paraburkholderia flava TaxID=2547393 RepID=UPI00105E4387|nr:type III secretion system cytoplasmic ring protein SctQ [Paraburkholderia flava]